MKKNFTANFDAYKGTNYENEVRGKAPPLEKKKDRFCRLCSDKLTPTHYFYCSTCHHRFVDQMNRGMD